MTRERCRTHSNSASGPLYQHRPSGHFASHVYGAMSCDAGYAKASALVRRHALRQESDMIERHNRELCGRAERPIRLRAVTPHRPPDPVGRYAFADLIDSPCAIAVRNDARVWHANAVRILTLLDVARIYARCRNPNSYLARSRKRIRHFANHEDFPRWPLLLVPCCPHSQPRFYRTTI